MKKIKRMLAIFLTFMLLFCDCCTGVLNAKEISMDEQSQIEEHAEMGSINESNLQVECTDSVSSLLSNDLQKLVQDEIETENGENSITEIVFENNKATVTYNIDETLIAEMLVCVYDETTLDMVASGLKNINVEENEMEIDITKNIPEYFIVKAYMLDSSSHELLCEPYTTNYYTEELQEIAQSKISDYDEDRIVNLDEDENTNFVVLNEDVITIEEQENSNLLEEQGEGIYTISNASDKVLSLKTGDIISYRYLNGEILVVKIAAVEVDGTSAILTEDTQVEREEVFDIVKIETTNDDSSFEVDNSTLDEEMQQISREEFENNMIDEPTTIDMNTNYMSIWNGELVDYDKTKTENVSYKSEKPIKIGGTQIKLECSISLSATVNVKVYISTSYKYASLVLDYSATAKASISGSGSKKITLGTLKFSPCTGIVIKFTPQAIFEFSAKLEWTATLKGSIGGAYDSRLGFVNKTKKPTFNSEVTFRGTAYFGIKGTLSGYVVSEDILKLSLSVEFGLPISASENKKTSVHTCNACIKGVINGKMTCTLSVEFLSGFIGDSLSKEKKLIDKTVKLSDFYFSLDHMKFALGTCPYQTTTCKKSGDTYTVNFNTPLEVKKFGMTFEFKNIKYKMEKRMSCFTCNVSIKGADAAVKSAEVKIKFFDGNGNWIMIAFPGYFANVENALITTKIDLGYEEWPASSFASCTIDPVEVYGVGDVVLYRDETYFAKSLITSKADIENEEWPASSFCSMLEMQSVNTTSLNDNATFSGLIRNGNYMLAVVKDSTAELLFSSDNIVYVMDGVADENGELDFNYEYKGNEEVSYLLFGKKTKKKLTEDNVQLENIIYDKETHDVSPVVKYKNATLMEGYDYILYGDTSVKEVGSYNVKVIGIGDYYSEVNKSFNVICEHNYIDKILEDSSNIITKPTALEKGTAYKVCELCEIQSSNEIFEIDEIPVHSIIFDNQELEMTVGDEKEIGIVILPDIVTKEELVWASSDINVATVDTKTGIVTALSKGKTTITVKTEDGRYEAVCEVTVLSKQEEITPEIPENPDDDPDKPNEGKKPSVSDEENGNGEQQQPASSGEQQDISTGQQQDSGTIGNEETKKPEPSLIEESKKPEQTEGISFNKGNDLYKIVSVSGNKGVVAYTGTVAKKKKSITIPKTVAMDGKTYIVTEIADNAFKGNAKLTNVIISANITKIGKNAFYGCKNLKKITIKSTKLKNVGKNAFKGINKKAVIKVPKKQLAKYKKLFNGKGLPKTVKIKK